MKNDRCCGKCRTPWSVCAKQRACPCHASSHLRDELEGNFNPTPEHDKGGYLKPGLTEVTNDTGRPEVIMPLFQEPTP